MPEARRAMVFDPGLWKHWEGRSVDGAFPLMRCLGGTDRGAVFETQFHSQAAVIKLIPGSPESIAARLASWETAAALSHPNLVPIFARGETELGQMRCAYLVTERADENLAEVLAERPLTPVETREMLLPVLSALRYLHGKGFVHDNLKPSNILASNEQVKISADSVVAGADAAGDCHAIGALVKHALGGRDPSSALPDPFAEISRTCLNPDPRVGWDIQRIQAILHTNPAQAWSRGARRGWWTLVAATLVAMGLFAFWASRDGRPDESAIEQAPRIAGPTPSPPTKQTLAKSAVGSTPIETKPSIEQQVTMLDGITQVLPKIPPAALNTINGRVRINVRVRIDGAGNVSEAILDPPPASKYFTDRVLVAAQAWRFPKGNASQEWVLHFELLRDQTRVSPAIVPSR